MIIEYVLMILVFPLTLAILYHGTNHELIKVVLMMATILFLISVLPLGPTILKTSCYTNQTVDASGNNITYYQCDTSYLEDHFLNYWRVFGWVITVGMWILFIILIYMDFEYLIGTVRRK